MQLGRPPAASPRDALDLATALRLATAARGHRPAVTVLDVGPDHRRDEQAFASLAQWVAKGAHLLEVDVDLGPGDLLHLDAPAGWLAAAVCLATWWVGAAVTDDPTNAALSVVHEARPGPQHLDVLRIGDAVDGSPLATGHGPAWASEVQSFPDQPPAPRAAGNLVAVVAGGEQLTQTQLLSRARSAPVGRLGLTGPLGLEALATWLAARPAATGDPVVFVPSGDRHRAGNEQVAHWLET